MFGSFRFLNNVLILICVEKYYGTPGFHEKFVSVDFVCIMTVMFAVLVKMLMILSNQFVAYHIDILFWHLIFLPSPFIGKSRTIITGLTILLYIKL